MPEKRIWIRRDRGDGSEEEVTEEWVKERLGRYNISADIEASMKAASKNFPLSTGFADYWPKE